MQPSYEQAHAYVASLTRMNPAEAVINWRCIHDTNKTVPAHSYDGTLDQLWQTLCGYNSQGYGVFANVNALDGLGRDLSNVAYVRAHVVDLDDTFTSQASYERAINTHPLPSFAVQTSPGKFHVYWAVEPYRDNDYYSNIQRKLRQLYNGDKSVIDATRVLRVPGFAHWKTGVPQQTSMWALGGYGHVHSPVELANSLAHVNVIENYGGRFPLGDPSMAAPSLDWLRFATTLVDPNQLDRGEWISFTAAIKQAGWSLTDEATLQQIWLDWCARYHGNDMGENMKQWNSLRETEVGWPSIERRTAVKAYMAFGAAPKHDFQPPAAPTPVHDAAALLSMQAQLDSTHEDDPYEGILSSEECKSYFKNCFFVTRIGQIFTSSARLLNSTQFNGAYGGKHFIITPTGKTTDEPWKAALRSTLWTIPKVDHIRFMPQEASYKIVEDELGRKGLNTYIPVKLKSVQGDVGPWLRHMELLMPDAGDRKIFFDFLAHNIKFPGFKIPWAPMVQSAEGAGKGFIQGVVESVLGKMYIYSPKAEELAASGNKFNAWMRGKLMIIVNEIKVDERRELIEVLKPMITDARIEIQSKGVDQEMEDNPANWLFFSNYKDAIPVSQNGRRYSIFYTPIQSEGDLLARGMNEDYYMRLFHWLEEKGGREAITHWLLNYPIEKGMIPRRAPKTTSWEEALRISRGPIEHLILEAVEDEVPGFKGGYISLRKVMERLKTSGLRVPSVQRVQTIIESLNYVPIGKTVGEFFIEGAGEKFMVYALRSDMSLDGYGPAQGYVRAAPGQPQ